MHKITKQVQEDKEFRWIITILVTFGVYIYKSITARLAARKNKAAGSYSAAISAQMSAGVQAKSAHAPQIPPVPAASLPEEGERITADTAADTPALNVTTDSDPEITAHRLRWRQAFIDTEIINRKY